MSDITEPEYAAAVGAIGATGAFAAAGSAGAAATSPAAGPVGATGAAGPVGLAGAVAGIASPGALYRATPVPAPAVLQATAQLCVPGARRIAPLVPASPEDAVEPCRALPAQAFEPCGTADALALCRALDRPLEALSSLIEVVASHPHQSEGLRALLERVGSQAASLYALVQRALADGAAAPAAATTPAVPAATTLASAAVVATSSSAACATPAQMAASPPAHGPALGSASTPTRDVGQRAALRKLTARECEVLVLVADGLATADIAHRLGITSATVRSHVQNILTRLGVCNRRQAAALLTGRLPPPAKARLRAARRAPEMPRVSAEPDADPSRPQQIRLAAAAPVQQNTSTRRSACGSAASTSTVTRLTSREVQVLRCLAAGLGRSEIAERLYVSPHTARTHIQRVLAKLGVHSALGAMAVARDVGLAPAT